MYEITYTWFRPSCKKLKSDPFALNAFTAKEIHLANPFVSEITERHPATSISESDGSEQSSSFCSANVFHQPLHGMSTIVFVRTVPSISRR